MGKVLTFNEIFNTVSEFDVSDIHLNVGYKPAVRVYGDIIFLDQFPVIEDTDMRAMAEELFMGRMYLKLTYDANGEIDFSYFIGNQRFRVNLYRVQNKATVAIRIVKQRVKTASELGILPLAEKVAEYTKGLILITGPTGSGKSTTLAAVVEHINTVESRKIITIEDPVEYKFTPNKCIINQRELGMDTKSFANALRGALREDPDIIMVGELRDAETINIALTAVETGHLVISTLHTQSAAQTIDRIIDVFPNEEQNRITSQLSLSLKLAVSQKLIKNIDGDGRVLCEEVLINNSRIMELIRNRETHEIMKEMQEANDGYTKTMDKTLAHLFRTGKISIDEVNINATDKEYIQRLLV